jgi:hypothetical protein
MSGATMIVRPPPQLPSPADRRRIVCDVCRDPQGGFYEPGRAGVGVADGQAADVLRPLAAPTAHRCGQPRTRHRWVELQRRLPHAVGVRPPSDEPGGKANAHGGGNAHTQTANPAATAAGAGSMSTYFRWHTAETFRLLPRR